MNLKIDKILIVSITPYFLEKGLSWFTENLNEILRAEKTQAFFQDNISFLESGQSYNFSGVLRKLDEMGYERVFKISDPGEFSQRGGIIEVFPINSECGARLDFLGNKIESIELLENIKIENEKKSKDILNRKLKSQRLFADLKNLKPGDFLVHLDHGVGKFAGIEKFEISQPSGPKLTLPGLLAPEEPQENEKAETKEYYILEYAGDDKLYVPFGLERKLSRYVGFSNPLISRLGSSLWQKTKGKIKEDVEKLAKELLSIYAQKEVVKRQPYSFDTEMEQQLKSGFLYEETPDQLQAIEDIKGDFKKDRPMDRIVCGDVGFGKTEVAMRASLFAANNNKQTAIITPTTILAHQHFNNFKKRFEYIPVKIALLSRLQKKSEQKKIIKEIKEGRIDIVIGTHRVLSNDIEFKNIQLLIIDDEQKFGVKQKEKLRKIKPGIDILSLSATPIPRTVYLALSSLKNISLMQTPPQGRTSVKTKISLYNKNEIKKAIEFELERNGQVYFLHNRIESIAKARHGLEKLLNSKKAKTDFIHGRMGEKQLVKKIEQFQKGETNILIATTIIENGIDLPRVNTIIIEDATRLGLAQAYQIRGRVGRSDTKGFAYLFYEKSSLTPLAKERLKALKEAEELGSGYRIAIKDLELRGAGNILGKQQSGSINKIGLNLYSQMLAEAVEKFKS